MIPPRPSIEAILIIANEQSKGLEYLLGYYPPYTRAYNAILAQMNDCDSDTEPRELPAPNDGKMMPSYDRGLFYVCIERGCNKLCPAELMKCAQHRDYNEPITKTDEPNEFYINPKFKSA